MFFIKKVKFPNKSAKRIHYFLFVYKCNISTIDVYYFLKGQNIYN